MEPEKPPRKIDPVQFGLNYGAGYDLERWQTWRESGGTIYPNGLARDAQSPSLMQDFRAISAVFAYWLAEYKKQHGASTGNTPNRTAARLGN